MAWTTKTQTSIGVRWDASSDNAGVTGYRVYRNGTRIATTTSTSYTVSGLTCGTSYTIALGAIDAAGNESNRAQASGTTGTNGCATSTPAPIPETTPTIPDVTPDVGRDATGLVGSWSFDESSGSTVVDGSGAGNAGTISGAKRVTGQHGRALQFDGVNDMVTVPTRARSASTRR